MAGCAILAGTNINKIVRHTGKLINDKSYYRSFIHGINPFGDGKAANRIVHYLMNHKNN